MIEQFWKAVLAQDRDGIRRFFLDDAHVNWYWADDGVPPNGGES